MAYLHDRVAVQQVLAHLGLSPPEQPKPPPAVHEVVRVPVDDEGAGRCRRPEDRQFP